MEKAECFPLELWGWNCPKCRQFNETKIDPAGKQLIRCSACHEVFIPVETSQAGSVDRFCSRCGRPETPANMVYTRLYGRQCICGNSKWVSKAGARHVPDIDDIMSGTGP